MPWLSVTIAELFRTWGIAEDYASLPEEEKCRLLEREIIDPRPIIPRLTDRFQPATQEVIATFLLIREQFRTGEPAAEYGALGSLLYGPVVRSGDGP